MARPGRSTLAWLAGAVLVVGIVAAWDWNWFRPAVERHLSERGQRSVVIGDLHLSLADGWAPTVRLRHVRIDNAPWAVATAGQPYAVAGEARFTFAWAGLFTGQPVVSRLLLRDADIALERRADDLRNWRVRQPEDRGPGKFRFLRLEAHNSRLRFVHEAQKLDLQTAAADLEAPVTVADGPPLTALITVQGRWRDAAFRGAVRASNVLTFIDTDEPFSVDGDVESGPVRLEARGTVRDLFRLGGVDAQVRLSGPSLSRLSPLVPGDWPASAAFDVAAQLVKSQERWDVTGLRAKLGRSDLTGEVRYDTAGERPFVEGALKADSLNVADLPLDRDTPRPTAAASAPAPASSASAPPSSWAGLQALDGDISLTAGTVRHAGWPSLQNLRGKVRWDRGVVDLSPLQAQLAGGTVQGRMSLDTAQTPASAGVDLTWRGVRLEQVLPPLPDEAEASGPVSGQLQLSSRGATWTALVTGAEGQGTARMKGGRLTAGLDAKLALNGGKLIRAAVTDAADVPVQCARVDVTLRQGKGDVHPVLLDTAHTRIDGRGQLDLSQRRFDLLLTPRPKQSAPLSLRQSIQVKGPFNAPDVSLVPQEDIAAAGGCDDAPADNRVTRRR